VVLTYLLAALLGYLVGSFPTGYLVGQAMGNVDVRQYGSGRTGGSNVLRTVGKKAALITVLGDIGKGVLAVLLAGLIWSYDPTATALAGFLSVIGHNHSLFLNFQGGAGTMTATGVLFALDPLVWFLTGIIPIIFAYITRHTSIGSLLLSSMNLLLGSVLVSLGYFPPPYLIFFVSFFLLSWHSLRPNIQRLRAGNERRVRETVSLDG